jgi:hypothetical protein
MITEKRIHRLEEGLTCPGTTISRVLLEGEFQWCVGIGQMMMPKDFFYGKTISEALSKAEGSLKKGKSNA